MPTGQVSETNDSSTNSPTADSPTTDSSTDSSTDSPTNASTVDSSTVDPPTDARRSLCVLAGDCVIRTEGKRARDLRGSVVVLVKPDNTVLVHDIDGYQPVAWLTRADSVSYGRDEGFCVTAVAGDQQLHVTAQREYGFGHYPASEAGMPVGNCRECDRALVRTGGAVVCVECDERYGLPSDARVLEDRCECGLPRMTVDRGARFDLCIDRACESLDAAVKDRFDREWECSDPHCPGRLRIIRRGGLLAGCERYPDCETGYVIPSGIVSGICACGLPTFETSHGLRCLDATCEEIG